MRRKYVAAITIVLAVAVVTGGSWPRANADMKSQGISLKDLAGNFAGEIAANLGICFNATFTTPQD